MGKIFLSYARADDEPFVKQLYQDLTEHGIDVWWDRKAMESRGRTFLQEIRDAIEGSDRLIAVIGPKAVISDYVKVEWEHALLFAKGVVPILRCGDYDLIPSELSSLHCPDFRKEQLYQDALAELVRILAKPVPLLGALRTEVPSLPPHFLPRRDELILLGNAVLADVQRPEAVTSAKQKTVIVGMGGIGKSVLAAAFARSTETRQAFTDGVAWISIGQNPDLLFNLRQIGLACKDKMENYVDLKTARDKLPGVLADKNCLIVLDDIWNVAHAEPFINAIGPRCRLLITTRDGGIASVLEANEHRLGVLSDAAALRFLANWCDKEVGSMPHEAVSVAKECGNLPFALALCGAMERDGTSWPDMLDALKEADLTFIEKKFPNYPYTDVLKSLKISVDALESEDLEAVKHYQNLVFFHSHKKIPEAAIMTLWMHTDELKERYARKLLTTLNSKALLTLDGETPHRFVTLHDLQHDYLRAIKGDQNKFHVELLEAYQKKCKDGWSTGPNDGYFFEHLSYHLVEARRKEELRQLLFDFDWIWAKLAATDVNSLITDYDFLPEDRQLRLVQGAIRLSSTALARDKTELVGQLFGRLQSFRESEIQSMLKQARGRKSGLWLYPLTASLTPPGPLMRTLEGHRSEVYAVAVTPDSRSAVSASSDYTMRVWDIESGVELRTLEDGSDYFTAVAVTPDGRFAVSASEEGVLKVWDIESGEKLRTLKGYTDLVTAVAVTPDGHFAVSASWDKTLKVWDL
ncbi:MAG: TIR domain-containing protein, partial [Candidatus Omnitrophica bacterium]|nr:TIR domain-containing protein [Candidatus Omnitrophota bacterium]